MKVLIQQFRLIETCYFLISFFDIFDFVESVHVHLRNCYQKYSKINLLEFALFVCRPKTSHIDISGMLSQKTLS